MADETPGWDAINAALQPLYQGRKEDAHWGTILKFMLGGPDPLDGVSAYRRDDHWHYVSYGLTELYAKETENKEQSGYGFELTFRLGRAGDEAAPPVWPVSLMQNLARYVFETGNVFGPGHHMTLNGPIALEENTAITAVLFVEDPELPKTGSPHGSFRFLQLVGITGDELEAVQAWNSTPFSALLQQTHALWATQLARRSLLDNPKLAQLVNEGIERDGSSMAELMAGEARWKKSLLPFGIGKVHLTVGALAVSGLVSQLRGRLGHDRPLTLIGRGDGKENFILFKSAAAASVGFTKDGYLTLEVPRALAAEMANDLRPQRGTWRWAALKHFELEVVPSEIKDSDGKVIRVVG